MTIPVFLSSALAWMRRLHRPLSTSASLFHAGIKMEDRYRPMHRLLSGDDEKFLAQAGCGPQGLRSFRARRRLLFRGYLRCLARDFNRVYWTLEIALIEAGKERTSVIRLLLRQRIRFLLAMLDVELRLAVHGWRVGKIDTQLMLESLETLRDDCSLLVAQREMAV